MNYIDLHTHTVHSDGTSTVENSLTQAQKNNLSIFSVSDHNAVSAYEEIKAKRDLFDGKILPGVEMSTTYRGEIVEVLGYGIDIAVMDKYIKENYMPLPQKRVEEAGLVAKALAEKNVAMSKAFFEAMCHDPESLEGLHDLCCRPMFLEEMRKFPENERFFESKEALYSMTRHRFTRDYLFNPDSTLYVDQSALYPSLQQVIGFIHTAGGLAFLAHTYVYSENIAASLDDITDNYELDGLECHYGTFTKAQKSFLSGYCDKKGIFKSGGSDFHGLDMRPENLMGLSAGEKIEQSLIDPWLDRVRSSLL